MKPSEIIKSVIDAVEMDESEFYMSSGPTAVDARWTVAMILMETGRSQPEVARVLDMDPSSISNIKRHFPKRVKTRPHLKSLYDDALERV